MTRLHVLHEKVQTAGWRHFRKLILPFAMLATLFIAPIASAAAAPVSPYTPVVIVHGYGSCQDVSTAMEGPFAEQYYSGTPASYIHELSYYGCDKNGESIQGYGPLNSPKCVSASAAVRSACPANLRSTDNDFINTDIRRFSYELAWYLSNKFGTAPVALVGHSMGGIILTYALQQIAAHNPTYPASLSVQTVVTFSTPFAGYNVGTTDLEARQMATSGKDSIMPGILKAGAPQMYKGKYTIWAAEGSSAGCDLIPASTTLVLPGETFAVDYATPCYGHTDYLWDAFQPADATGTENGAPFTGGYHSLDFMHYLISYQESVYNH